jgi:glycosyltransferase involved in cell wall biosynthesis
MTKICILPEVKGLSGVASFRIKLEEGLRSRGVAIAHKVTLSADAVLVLAGTRNLLPLWRARLRGQKIAQRLDGINWVHRRRNTGLRHYVRAEYGNFVLSLIRSRIATKIIYQSEFSRNWWNDRYGEARIPSAVIHNGIDLNAYFPGKAGIPPQKLYNLLIVEGNLGGGYDMGLDNALELAETLKVNHDLPIALTVVGRITDEHRERVSVRARIPIQWMGVQPRERIPEIMRSAHAFFSSDLHPACPNSVIEALACGLPVVAFDTGSLKELVVGDAGRIVPYGSDSWKIEIPDIPALAKAAHEVLKNQPHFRKAARAHAESALGLDKMVDEYLKALLD